MDSRKLAGEESEEEEDEVAFKDSKSAKSHKSRKSVKQRKKNTKKEIEGNGKQQGNVDSEVDSRIGDFESIPSDYNEECISMDGSDYRKIQEIDKALEQNDLTGGGEIQ